MHSVVVLKYYIAWIFSLFLPAYLSNGLVFKSEIMQLSFCDNILQIWAMKPRSVLFN